MNRMPLEDFLVRYIDSSGGACDCLEPQVYDVLMPPEESRGPQPADQALLRLAFDPEALPEHPGAQLAGFGTPLVDRLLQSAIARGSRTELYRVGLAASPRQAATCILRTLTLPAATRLEIVRARTTSVAQAVFWFEATFVSDQKEQELVPVGIDLLFGRQVRHLDLLLDRSSLAEAPGEVHPELRRISLPTAYTRGRDRVFRTFAAMANSRQRELGERLDRQSARMNRYYADLCHEIDDSLARARSRGDDPAKLLARQEACRRESELRISELRRKSALQMHVRLVGLAVIRQPKLIYQAQLLTNRLPPAPLELVWDPLTESLEAPECGVCRKPTFTLAGNRGGAASCEECLCAETPRPVKANAR